MSYLKHPQQYNPEKRGLFGYLVMSADGDLRNALAKQRRRSDREISLEEVELERVGGNREGENASNLDLSAMIGEIKNLFENPVDQRVLELIVEGERSTNVFAEALGLSHLPVFERRREVKRHKDRIKKRLERYGRGIRRPDQ